MKAMRRRDDGGPPGATEARFATLYRDHAREVLAYAVRRGASAEDAADVVAEAFLVAWRRGADVPRGDGARLWLYGVARRTLANQRRGERRRTRLAARMRAELPAILAAAVPAPTAADHEVLTAIAALRESDREVLLLSAWEQLSPAEIAQVLAITPLAVRSRLHRARRRVQDQLAGPAAGAPSVPPALEPEKAR
jgi:RNA polymerase sigma-70 factor (ECF subfamily)